MVVQRREPRRIVRREGREADALIQNVSHRFEAEVDVIRHPVIARASLLPAAFLPFALLLTLGLALRLALRVAVLAEEARPGEDLRQRRESELGGLVGAGRPGAERSARRSGRQRNGQGVAQY